LSYTFRALVGGQQYDLPDWTDGPNLGYDFSDIGVISGSYALNGVNFDKLVDGAVIIAMWDGQEPYDSRFIVQAGEGDDDGETTSEKIVAKSLLDIFRRVVVDTGDQSSSVVFDSATPGGILNNLLSAAQSRGSATGISWDFTNATDSAGVPWDKVISIEYKMGLKYIDFIRNLVDQGMIELRFNGTVLQAFNADTMGVDRSIPGLGFVELVAGLDYTELPRKWSSEERARRSLVLGDEGIVVRNENQDVPVGPFGKEEMALSQGGTKNIETLTLINNAALNRVSQVREQLTRKAVIREGGKVPGVDYRVSDYISDRVSDSRTGVSRSERYRVRSMVIEVKTDGTVGNASIVLNDKFLEAEIRTARKVAGIIGGATAEGGGNGIPATEVADTTTPNPPAGVVVSSFAYLDANGRSRTTMRVGWNPPTHNTDGSAISDLKEYEMQYRVVSMT